MSETYTDEIEWDKGTFEVFEKDIDGHGTRVGLVTGYKSTGVGRGQGVEEWEAEASSLYPYEDVEIDEETVEFVSFAENEPEEA